MANYKINLYRISQAFADQTTFFPKDSKITLADPLQQKGLLTQLFELTLLHDGESSKKIQLDKDRSFTVTFSGIRYRKEMYKPGWAEIKLHISDFTSSSKTSDPEEFLEEYFQGCIVDVEDTKSNLVIAQHYYIFDIQPSLEKSNQHTSIQLTLTAYSPDKFLTLDKFSMAYIHKRLFDEMVPTTLTRHQKNASFRYFIGLTKSIEAHLNLLTAAKTTQRLKMIKACLTDSDLQKQFQKLIESFSGKFQDEYIMPYSVQYNESFHDFLVRMLNRYAEFLYMEQGVLHIGLPEPPESCLKITDYQSRSYLRHTFQTLDNVRVVHPTSTDKSDYGTDSTASHLIYNSEIASDEQWAPLKKKSEEFDAAAAAKSVALSMIGKASEYLNKPDLGAMLAQVAWIWGWAMWDKQSKNAKKVAKFNEAYFSEVGKSYNEKKRGNQYDSKKALFAPMTNITGYDKHFLHRIRLEEEEMSNSQIQVVFDGDASSLLLGTFFTLDNSSKKHVAVRIEGEAQWIQLPAPANENQEQQQPAVTGEYVSSLTLVGIPVRSNSEGSFCCPPIADVEPIRKSGPQIAYVVANDDPMGLDRIRIKYPWQALDITKIVAEKDEEKDDLKEDERKSINSEVLDFDEDASPWIRISSPMASEDSGFHFIPELKDEVLINYENGNIEHPYMVGALYNGRKKPGASGSDKSITSCCGHSITFQEADNASGFITNALPSGIGTLLEWIPQLKPLGDALEDTENAKYLGGGIKISDKYGFYSISMSTEDRAVKIKCPLGDIGLSAYSGISISAPNGDVKITGKNVTIKAGNNLSISSGGNIKAAGNGIFASLAKSFGTTLYDNLKSKYLESLVDMSIIRTVLETFLKPISGTLSLQSKRYLLLSAGEGKAKINDEEYKDAMSVGMFTKQALKGAVSSYIGSNNYCIHSIDAFISGSLTSMIKNFASARTKLKAYQELRVTLDTDFPEADWKKDVENIIKVSEGKNLWISGSVPELKLQVYTTYNEALKKHKKEVKEAKGKTTVVNGQKVPVAKPVFNQVAPKVAETDLLTARQELFDALIKAHARTMIKELHEKIGITSSCYDTITKDTDYENVLNQCDVKGKNADQILAATNISNSYNKFIMVALRRKLVYACLKAKLFKEMDVDAEVELTNDFSDEKWAEMIESIDYPDFKKQDGKLTKSSRIADALAWIKDEVVDATGFDGFMDQYVWDQADKGEILFANDKTTMHFDGKNVEAFAKKRELPIDDLKTALTNIKL